MSDQLSLLVPAEFPAPYGFPPYSHRVVWEACLLWELKAWVRARRAAA
jgi:hypothetical protein